jgi:hypothetical protein
VHDRVLDPAQYGIIDATITAEVANGIWIGQEPSWDSPINRGSHCAKGAAVRELVHGDRRLKYPMKLVNGQWSRDQIATSRPDCAQLAPNSRKLAALSKP